MKINGAFLRGGSYLERAEESVEKRLGLRVEVLQLAYVPVCQRRIVLERLELAVMQPSRALFHVMDLQHRPGQRGVCTHNHPRRRHAAKGSETGGHGGAIGQDGSGRKMGLQTRGENAAVAAVARGKLRFPSVKGESAMPIRGVMCNPRP